MAEIGCEDKGINFDWISIKRTSLKNPKMYFFNVAEILNAIPSDNIMKELSFTKPNGFQMFTILPSFHIELNRKTNKKMSELFSKFINHEIR